MRNVFIYYIKIGLMFGVLLPMGVSAEPSVLFSDVSAGIFRFQIKLAEQGNPEAQYKVGEMFELGAGVEKDLETAHNWFEKALAQGHEKSKFKLLYLEIGTNGLNDFSKSQLGILRQNAASGNANAQYFLGKMYSTGVGVPKSLNNALTWLNKATFNGIAEAEHEAIAVEEELIRIREKEARKREAALGIVSKRKAEDDRAKVIRQEAAARKSRLEAATRKNNKAAEERRLVEQRRRVEAERKAMEVEKAQLALERKRLLAERESERERAEQAAKLASAKKIKAKKSKSKFESDPCKGKSARFLSTCR